MENRGTFRISSEVSQMAWNWGTTTYGRQLYNTDGVYTFVFWRSGSDPLPGWKTLAEMAGQKLCFQSTLGTTEAQCESKNLFDCNWQKRSMSVLSKKAEFSNTLVIDAIFFKCKEQRRIIFGHRFFQLSVYFCETATASKMMVTNGVNKLKSWI